MEWFILVMSKKYKKRKRLLMVLGGAMLIGSISILASVSFNSNEIKNNNLNRNSIFAKEKNEVISLNEYQNYLLNQRNKEKVLKSSINSGNVRVAFNSKIINNLILGKEGYYSKAINNLIAQNNNDLVLKINGTNSPVFNTPLNLDGFGNYYSDRHNPKSGEK